MLPRVKVHPGFLLGGGFVWYNHPTAALRSRGGLDEYRGAPPHRRPLAVLKSLKGHGWAARGARMVWTPPEEVSVNRVAH